MEGGITRIISSDDMRKVAGYSAGQAEEQGTDEHDQGTGTPHSSHYEKRSPAVVENDMDIDVHCTPRSSVSDVSEAVRSDGRLEAGDTSMGDPRPLQRTAVGQQAVVNVSGATSFPPQDTHSIDSSSASMKGSSQNSSRDWGWYESPEVRWRAREPVFHWKRNHQLPTVVTLS